MSISRLRQIVAPPAQPVGTGTPAVWRAVEALLSTTLPQDYKQFVATYGVGQFNQFLLVRTPFPPRSEDGVFDIREPALAIYTNLHRSFPNDLPIPPYPEPGGLLPCAETENGDTLFWRTAGVPNAWPVVLLPRANMRLEQFDMLLTPFLAELLSGSIRPFGFPDSFFVQPPTFSL